MSDRGDVIDQRLRAACVWRDPDIGVREGVDLSAEAITDRLMEACEMSSLCLELASVGQRARGS